MTRGIIISIILIIIFFFLGAITSAISFILLAPVIFTPTSILSDIIKIMKIKKGDRVLDLGSGDGRLLFEIYKDVKGRKLDIKLFGYEISPILVILSKLKQLLRLRKGITFDILNIFEINLSEYNKIYCYLDVRSMSVLEKNIKKQMEQNELNTELYSYRLSFKNFKPHREYILANGETLFHYIF